MAKKFLKLKSAATQPTKENVCFENAFSVVVVVVAAAVAVEEKLKPLNFLDRHC